MVFRHGEDNSLPKYSVGDVVSLELAADRKVRPLIRRMLCQILNNSHGDLF
jgi:hypothetical protein